MLALPLEAGGGDQAAHPHAASLHPHGERQGLGVGFRAPCSLCGPERMSPAWSLTLLPALLNLQLFMSHVRVRSLREEKQVDEEKGTGCDSTQGKTGVLGRKAGTSTPGGPSKAKGALLSPRSLAWLEGSLVGHRGAAGISDYSQALKHGSSG